MQDHRPLIVFDVPGVLLTDAMPRLLRALAQRGVRWNEKAFSGWYYQEIEPVLMLGKMHMGEFWETMLDNEGIPLAETSIWEDYLRDATLPLIAKSTLQRWSSVADLAVVANGLPEWWAVPLRETGINTLLPLRHIVLSANYGSALPEPDLFHTLIDLLPTDPDDVLFISSDSTNCCTAEYIGWSWILADPEGTWSWEVDEYLNLEDPGLFDWLELL